jgi:anti-sigma-K factor RskA
MCRRCDVQVVHSPRPAGAQPDGAGWTDALLWRSPVLTVLVLVAFFALLTVADLVPGPADVPGLVAPLG